VAAEGPKPGVLELPRAPGIAQLQPSARKNFFRPGGDGTRIDDRKTIEGDRLYFRAARRPRLTGRRDRVRSGHTTGCQRHKLPTIDQHDVPCFLV
jgi:hypothetical protein